MIVSALVAAARNGVIGRDNQLPWRLPNDLKFFKRMTLGKPIIMGRKTHESIGRALPGRRNLVITRNPEYRSEGGEVFGSLVDALKACMEEVEVCIIGGASIYNQAFELDLVDKLYLTRVEADVEGDTFFTVPTGIEWAETDREAHPADKKHAYPYTFITLEKRVSGV